MQQASLTWPSAAQRIQSQADTLTTQVSAMMNTAVARLSNIEGDAGYPRHDLSHEAEGLLGLRSALETLLIQGQVLTVSPYQYQVGSQQASGHYLTPRGAIDTLIMKLKDQVDKHRPTGTMYCIAFMVSDSQLTDFADKLTQLTGVLPLPDWCQVAKQSTALSTESVDNFYQPLSITQPRFKPKANLNAQPFRDYLKLQTSQLSTLESLAHDKTNVIGKLQALAEKRASMLTAVSLAIEALKTLPVSLYSASLSGTSESIAAQLSALSMPNSHPYTVASLLLSSEPLTFFEALLCSA